MRAAAGLRAGLGSAAGCRLQRLLSAPRLSVVLSRHPSVAGCSRGIAPRIGVVKAARISCYSTNSEGAASKDESRRQAYRLMARSHAKSDEGHTPKPDAIDVLVEQVAAEKLVRSLVTLHFLLPFFRPLLVFQLKFTLVFVHCSRTSISSTGLWSPMQRQSPYGRMHFVGCLTACWNLVCSLTTSVLSKMTRTRTATRNERRAQAGRCTAWFCTG